MADRNYEYYSLRPKYSASRQTIVGLDLHVSTFTTMGGAIIQVRDELTLLLGKQSDAWERAMAIGLTEEEIYEYEEREKLFRNLLQELDAQDP